MGPWSYVLAKLVAVAQALALLSLPALVRPHWESLVALLGGPQRANVFGIPLLHLAVLVVANALFLCVYAAHHPFFEQFKISGRTWAWRSPNPSERASFAVLVRNAVLVTAFNVALTVPLSALNYDLSLKLGHSASLDTYPSTPTVALHILLFTLVEDALFYAAHRTFHAHPLLYRAVHKFHHRWAQSVSISAESTHPLEFVVGNVIPFAAGPMLVGAHLVTNYVWVLWRIGETVMNHSGYAFPWSLWSILPFQGSAAAHDAHHSINTGNFASFYVFHDRVWGTEIPEEAVEANLASEKRAAAEDDERMAAEAAGEGAAGVAGQGKAEGGPRQRRRGGAGAAARAA
jgi:4-alpha-methyl-delta7-sterol-4alpha-methyl oxidase